MPLGVISLPTASVSHLDDAAELGVHGLGEVEAEVMLHDVGGAALARLGVDADDGLILPAHVGRVDGQIGDLPELGAALAHVRRALVDGVLMRAGEGGEDQLSSVRLALAHLHFGAALVHIPDLVHVGKSSSGSTPWV